METDGIRAAARSFFEDVWSKGDMAVAEALLSDDFKFVLSFMHTDDLDSFKQLVKKNRTSFENLTYRPDEIIVEGDKAAATWTMSAKHVGEWAGIAGTGREVSIEGMTLFHIEGEKIVRASVQNDVFGLRKQLGAA